MSNTSTNYAELNVTNDDMKEMLAEGTFQPVAEQKTAPVKKKNVGYRILALILTIAPIVCLCLINITLIISTTSGYAVYDKSTLLNALTGAGIPANDRLFDTLDTTTRRLKVSDHLEILLSDTVGFIAKLPHHLIEAFQATLEELQYADLLLHVIDASDPHREAHIEVVDRLIEKLAKPGVPVLRCYNKADLVGDVSNLPIGEKNIPMCARSGIGMDELLMRIEETLTGRLHRAVFLLPYSDAGALAQLHEQAQVLRVDYLPEGVEVEAVCREELFGRLKRFVKEPEA